MWKMVLSSSRCAGTSGLMTFSSTSFLSCSCVYLGSCCVLTTMVCTRFGVRKPPRFSYSIVTCVLPSGRSSGITPFLRTTVSW